MIFSWQAEPWEQLCSLRKEKRLPHALLLTGPRGIGKRTLAQHFARLVLCQTAHSSEPCGACHACHLMQAESHPDFRLIQPEEEGHAIKIDQIRELSEFSHQTSHQGGLRVVLIQPATAMNHYAANALLKTLEEPAPDTLIILISDNRTKLPISQDEGVAWEPILEATQGAPLLAKAWHEEAVWPLYQTFMRDLAALTKQEADPLQLAVQWKDANLLWVFDLFFQWLLKLLRMQMFPDHQDEFSGFLPERFNSSYLLEFVDFLQRMRAEVLGPYNLNQQLMLEALFIRWVQYVAR
jgi:DNA polymerase-3 subunit delta'